MTLKLTAYFAQDRYTWTETHYLLNWSVLSSGVGPALAYAAKRVPCLGNDASLTNLRLSEVPANREVSDVDPALWAASPVWPSDPTNLIYASDRAYSALLVRMKGTRSSRNWYLSGGPDASIQSVKGQTSGVVISAAGDLVNRLTAFLNSLLSGSWGFRSQVDSFAVQSVGLVTNAGFPNMIGIQTANALGAAIGSEVVLRGWRRINPRSPGLSGVFTVAGVLAPVAPATNWTTFLLETGDVSLTNFLTLGTIGALTFEYVAYTDYAWIKAVSKKRGGSAFLPRGRSRTRP